MSEYCRSLALYERANKELDTSRAKNKEVTAAEQRQSEACAEFERLSGLARWAGRNIADQNTALTIFFALQDGVGGGGAGAGGASAGVAAAARRGRGQA